MDVTVTLKKKEPLCPPLISMDIKLILLELKKELKRLYSARLSDVILYGSFARGEGTKDSDIDIMVLLDGKVDSWQEIDRTIDLITEINLKYDILISLLPIAKEDYYHLNMPIILSIRSEGIVI